MKLDIVYFLAAGKSLEMATAHRKAAQDAQATLDAWITHTLGDIQNIGVNPLLDDAGTLIGMLVKAADLSTYSPPSGMFVHERSRISEHDVAVVLPDQATPVGKGLSAAMHKLPRIPIDRELASRVGSPSVSPSWIGDCCVFYDGSGRGPVPVDAVPMRHSEFWSLVESHVENASGPSALNLLVNLAKEVGYAIVSGDSRVVGTPIENAHRAYSARVLESRNGLPPNT